MAAFYTSYIKSVIIINDSLFKVQYNHIMYLYFYVNIGFIVIFSIGHGTGVYIWSFNKINGRPTP